MEPSPVLVIHNFVWCLGRLARIGAVRMDIALMGFAIVMLGTMGRIVRFLLALGHSLMILQLLRVSQIVHQALIKTNIRVLVSYVNLLAINAQELLLTASVVSPAVVCSTFT